MSGTRSHRPDLDDASAQNDPICAATDEVESGASGMFAASLCQPGIDHGAWSSRSGSLRKPAVGGFGSS
jgi:hypothetical protein